MPSPRTAGRGPSSPRPARAVSRKGPNPHPPKCHPSPFPRRFASLASTDRINYLRQIPDLDQKTLASRVSFADLPYYERQAAQRWYWKFCQRWGNDLPPWRRAILSGVARRLAKNPPTPSWLAKMNGSKAAKAQKRLGHPNLAKAKQARENSLRQKRGERLPVRQLPLG